METVEAIYDNEPKDTTVGRDVYLIRDNISSEIVTDGDGNAVKQWRCTEHRLSRVEYDKLLDGIIDGSWTPALHGHYREKLHQTADSLLAIAYRKKRQAEDVTPWAAYITAMDRWNDLVSAMAETMTTDVPDLPDMP
ncbi:MAG: hypothetical protein RBR71_13000 [Gudongella sp.]|nr:hypothetical protein [Gudongella sp.]